MWAPVGAQAAHGSQSTLIADLSLLSQVPNGCAGRFRTVEGGVRLPVLVSLTRYQGPLPPKLSLQADTGMHGWLYPSC